MDAPGSSSAEPAGELPLAGVRVLDFSALLPGPLATLLLAEAGAEVVRVERPGGGDEMRSYLPRLGDDSANFVLLNRGKRSMTVDLKDPDERARLIAEVDSYDVLVEQFRPGVMERFGLGYEQLAERSPGLIYCSITGYGQSGPRSVVAGHDLNYVADAGLLDRVRVDGTPVLPHALLADIAGGAYPAVMNVLMALFARTRTGRGRHIDIAMADGVLTFLYAGLARGHADGSWPAPNSELVTGGSPRYGLYRAADGRFIAAAPIEDRFWTTFCEIVGVDPELRDDRRDPEATRAAVAAAIAANPAAAWAERFAGADVCCSVVRTLQEAIAEPQFAHRGLFDRKVAGTGGAAPTIPALPLPLDRGMRRPERILEAPPLAPARGGVAS